MHLPGSPEPLIHFSLPLNISHPLFPHPPIFIYPLFFFSPLPHCFLCPHPPFFLPPFPPLPIPIPNPAVAPRPAGSPCLPWIFPAKENRFKSPPAEAVAGSLESCKPPDAALAKENSVLSKSEKIRKPTHLIYKYERFLLRCSTQHFGEKRKRKSSIKQEKIRLFQTKPTFSLTPLRRLVTLSSANNLLRPPHHPSHFRTAPPPYIGAPLPILNTRALFGGKGFPIASCHIAFQTVRPVNSHSAKVALRTRTHHLWQRPKGTQTKIYSATLRVRGKIINVNVY